MQLGFMLFLVEDLTELMLILFFLKSCSHMISQSSDQGKFGLVGNTSKFERESPKSLLDVIELSCKRHCVPIQFVEQTRAHSKRYCLQHTLHSTCKLSEAAKYDCFRTTDMCSAKKEACS